MTHMASLWPLWPVATRPIFSTELEIQGHSRRGVESPFPVVFGETRNSVAGEAANRDGLK